MKPIICILSGMMALPLLSLGITSEVAASDKEQHEHDAVREALRRGEVLPLAKVLAIAARHVPGDIIEIELEDNREKVLIYEIKVLTESGRVRKLKIDARTGAVLKIEDK